MANKELLRKVMQHIKDNPEQFDAVRWHADFAGWTLRLAVPGVEMRKDKDDIESLYDASGDRIWIADIGPMAQRLLDLTMIDAARLFSAGNTLDDVQRLVAEFTASVTA